MRKIKRHSKRASHEGEWGGWWQRITLPFRYPRIALCCLLLIAVGWAWYVHVPEKLAEWSVIKIDRISAAVGLEIKDIYLEGRVHASAEEIERAVSVAKGQSILRVPLGKMRKQLETVPWVRSAVVERLLPSTLSIHIIEREPIAIWQHQGKLHVIDSEGSVIEESNLASFSHLVILVGVDVPSFAASLLSVLQSEPSLQPKVSSAIRVGERRWNIRLQNGIEIRLPEEDQEKAWHALAAMHAESKLLDAPIKTIDMRVPDKVYIKKK